MQAATAETLFEGGPQASAAKLAGRANRPPDLLPPVHPEPRSVSQPRSSRLQPPLTAEGERPRAHRTRSSDGGPLVQLGERGQVEQQRGAASAGLTALQQRVGGVLSPHRATQSARASALGSESGELLERSNSRVNPLSFEGGAHSLAGSAASRGEQEEVEQQPPFVPLGQLEPPASGAAPSPAAQADGPPAAAPAPVPIVAPQPRASEAPEPQAQRAAEGHGPQATVRLVVAFQQPAGAEPQARVRIVPAERVPQAHGVSAAQEPAAANFSPAGDVWWSDFGVMETPAMGSAYFPMEPWNFEQLPAAKRFYDQQLISASVQQRCPWNSIPAEFMLYRLDSAPKMGSRFEHYHKEVRGGLLQKATEWLRAQPGQASAELQGHKLLEYYFLQLQQHFEPEKKGEFRKRYAELRQNSACRTGGPVVQAVP